MGSGNEEAHTNTHTERERERESTLLRKSEKQIKWKKEMIRNQKGVVVGFWVLPEENIISTHANDKYHNNQIKSNKDRV